MTTTPNLGLTKPVVGADTDDWGDELNATIDILDERVSAAFIDVRARNADTTGATDSSGIAQTALGDLPAGGTLKLVGHLKWDAGLTVDTPGTSIVGEGMGKTRVDYTPTTGVAIHYAWGGADRMTGGEVKGFHLVATGATTSQVGIELDMIFSADLEKLQISNFFGGVRITGNGTDRDSFWNSLEHLLIEGYTGAGSYGLSVDHAAETQVDKLYCYAAVGSTTGAGIVLDRGVDTFRGSHINTEEGKHGLLVRTTDLGGAWGLAVPENLWFTNASFDSPGGGDCVHFDASLGTNRIHAEFDLCWAAGASTASGLGISGGTLIKWRGGWIRYNGIHGVHVDGPSKDVWLDEVPITSNNTSNNADGHGVYVDNVNATVRLRDCRIGNVADYDTGGHQKYGVKNVVTGGAHATVIRRGGDWTGNETGTSIGPVEGELQVVGEADQPVFANAWGRTFADGNAKQAPAFQREDQTVTIMGVASGGVGTTLGMKVFTLPTRYRPAVDQEFAVVNNNGFGRLIVQSNGDVIPQTGGGPDWFWLSCSFRAAE